MRFFLDNCTSLYHAKGMAGFGEADGHTFQHLREKFPQDTKDLTWIQALGDERDWIILSGDTKISRNPAERAAWIESSLTAFFFGEPWMNDGFWKQCASLVAWWPTILAQAKKTPKSHGFLLPKGGKELKQIYPIQPKKK